MPLQFGGSAIAGAKAGATVGTAVGGPVGGLVGGAVGGVVGLGVAIVATVKGAQVAKNVYDNSKKKKKYR